MVDVKSSDQSELTDKVLHELRSDHVQLIHELMSLSLLIILHRKQEDNDISLTGTRSIQHGMLMLNVITPSCASVIEVLYLVIISLK